VNAEISRLRFAALEMTWELFRLRGLRFER